MFSAAASAADLPAPVYKAPPPVYSPWTGCYIGVGVGYSKSTSDSVPITGDPNLQISQTIGNAPYSLDTSGDGIIAGPHIGCNWETNRIVVGIETDLYYTDIERAISVTQGPNIVTTTFSSELKYLGTLRARLGVAVESALFYVTGGLAYGDVEASASAGDLAGTSFLAGSRSKVQFGYAVGGGIEYAFAPNWSLRGEYLYYDLGDETLTINAVIGPAETANFHYDTSGHLFRAALSYRF